MAKRKRVALLVEPWTSYGRDILRGIAQFAGVQENWTFDFEHAAATGYIAQKLPEGLDGVIARIGSEAVATALRDSGAAVVNIGDSMGALGFHSVQADSLAVGRLAATHLLDRGFETFGAVGFAGMHYSELRLSGFCRLLEAHGNDVDVLELSGKEQHGIDRTPRLNVIAQWLAKLDRPVGIFAANDEIGRHACEACRAAELRVPEDVAVVGVDDDEVLCELSNPPLSSVALNAMKMGYTAAQLLKRLMDGARLETEPRLIDPVGVTVRRSTQTVAVDDEVVSDALEYIWQHSGEGLSVEDLVSRAGVSRRWLEVRFRRSLGRSPATEIRRAQLDRAKRLLVDTDLMIPQVAAASGFSDPKVMIAVFRRELQTTPTGYRKTHRLS